MKALSTSCVDANEIARIRRDLGLAAESGMDKTLHERSLKPLARQQVRQILDRNAGAINNGDTLAASTASRRARRPLLDVVASFDTLNA